jgi:hypothetical protein
LVQGDEGPAQVVRLGHRGTPSVHTATMVPSPRRLPHSISWSHFGARATLSLFATSRFEWDLCATYRSEPILPPIPPSAHGVSSWSPFCGARIGIYQGTPSQACLRWTRPALVECALTWCSVLKGLPTFSARIGGQPMTLKLPSATIAVNRRNGGYLTFAVALADGVVAP